MPDTLNPKSKRNGFSAVDSSSIAAVLVLAAALLARLIWLGFTGFTEEDSFIVYRFAGNIAAGMGFVFNPGEPVYGTTTPLFTLVMAGWRWLTGGDFILGARLACIGASLAGLALLDASLRRLDVPAAARLLALSLFAISSKSILMDTQGMETPFVILFMAASWYMFASNKPAWAGFFAGLLLWTRIDTLLWPLALLLAACLIDIRRALRILTAAGLTYLPWLAYAYFTFGSPVPLTVIAKWIAGGMYDLSVPEHLTYIIGFLSSLDYGPFSLSRSDVLPALIGGWLVLCLAAWHTLFSVRKPSLLVLPIFTLMEIFRLADTRAAIDYRYYYPLLWSAWILFALGLHALWGMARQRDPLARWIPRLVLVGAAAAILVRGGMAADVARQYQIYRNEASLKAVGLWLNENTPADAAVLLEPLGYIGYYSERKMIDTVGLITPRAIALRMRGVPIDEFYLEFQPDYVVQRCYYEVALKSTPDKGRRFLENYRKTVMMNPLNYNPLAEIDPQGSIMPWVSCYEVWQKTATDQDQ